MQVNGQAVMPGAGFFEAAACAASAALPHTSSAFVGLCNVSIPAPLLLQQGMSTVLETAVNCAAGRVDLSSLAGKGRQIHCRASICQADPGICVAHLGIAHLLKSHI